MPDRERWVLTIEPLPDDVPAAVRIRALLKRMLRTLRLRCVSIAPEAGCEGEIMGQKNRRPYGMPPASSNPEPLLGPDVESFTVGSWCPTPDGTPTAVAISIRIPKLGDIVLRIKSPMELAGISR